MYCSTTHEGPWQAVTMYNYVLPMATDAVMNTHMQSCMCYGICNATLYVCVADYKSTLMTTVTL